jgi:caa(3)-type oxidase subunit IV
MSEPAHPHAPAATHDHGHPAAHAAGGHDGHDEHHEVHSVQHYVKIWAILIVLFIVSVLGPTLEIQLLTLITAFGIAIVKASMVVKYFMHLDVEKRIVHYFLATALVFMFLFFAGVAPDVMKHTGTQWVNVSAEEAVEKGMAAGVSDHGTPHGAAPHGATEAGHPPGGEAHGNEGKKDGGH